MEIRKLPSEKLRERLENSFFFLSFLLDRYTRLFTNQRETEHRRKWSNLGQHLGEFFVSFLLVSSPGTAATGEVYMCRGHRDFWELT